MKSEFQTLNNTQKYKVMFYKIVGEKKTVYINLKNDDSKIDCSSWKKKGTTVKFNGGHALIIQHSNPMESSTRYSTRHNVVQISWLIEELELVESSHEEYHYADETVADIFRVTERLDNLYKF